MEPPERLTLVFRTPIEFEARLRAAIQCALDLHQRSDASMEVLLTDDEEMQALNRQFRGIDTSTDVLSFPGAGFPNAPLGEIAISLPYAQRQADARKVSLEQEVCYLAIHGVLHLLGYEDEEDEKRAEMVAEMNQIALKAGLQPDEDWYSLLKEVAK